MRLGHLPRWRHVLALCLPALIGGLTWFGLIGGGHHPERFDAKQITVSPVGADGLRIREVVDEDFGTNDRHGYQRVIPNNFGVPTAVTASSPDAPSDVDVSRDQFGDTRIRIGNPATTVAGQHRYVLEYTLPEARLSSGRLALDIVAPGTDHETGRFEVVVTGIELSDPTCNVGRSGAVGGCELSAVDGGGYRAQLAPLAEHDGLTIGGDIVGAAPLALPDVPPLPDRRSGRSPALAVGLAAAGLASVGAVFAWARRRGSNLVFAGGAADAAYGAPTGVRTPPEGAGWPSPSPTGSVRVTDERLADFATTEFVPPPGLRPWQGAVLLRERVDDAIVADWFSGLIADQSVVIDDKSLRRGPHSGDASPGDRARIDRIFGSAEVVDLGTYDTSFATVWQSTRNELAEQTNAAQWWTGRRLPEGGGGMKPAQRAWFSVVIFGVLVGWFGSIGLAFLGALANPVLAGGIAVLVPAAVAYAVYRILLPSRTATGSALAIRTESFRRFLAASEGRHVEWAWSKGLLREYSAWAVALGAADAWQAALDSAHTVPRSEIDAVRGPILLYSSPGAWSTARTAPAPSGGAGGGGFGGGGFSGGSVGGGGGGGSSGSW